MNEVTPEEIEKQAVHYLDQVLELKLRLSEEESEYDLVYIGEKLSKCSSYCEKLSDIQLYLLQLKLKITSKTSDLQSLYRLKKMELKESEAYRVQPREKKTAWLWEQLRSLTEAKERWTVVNRVVSEIREAVSERVKAMNRLDSDLRLQQKLLEAKVASGAIGPTSSPKFTGSGDELDLK